MKANIPKISCNSFLGYMKQNSAQGEIFKKEKETYLTAWKIFKPTGYQRNAEETIAM